MNLLLKNKYLPLEMEINPEVQLIFIILNTDKDIDNIRRFLDSDKRINWDKFSSYSVKHGVAALLYQKLANLKSLHLIPDEVIGLFKQHYFKTIAKNTVLNESLRILAKEASKKNIDLLLLKGISLINSIYQDIGIRPMSDMDILVKTENVPLISNILESLNYGTNPIVKSKLVGQVEHFHLPAFISKSNHVMVELHTHIHPEKSPLSIDIDEFWKNSVPVDNFNTNIRMLSPENLIQHLCIHISTHSQTNNIRLSHFYDLVKVIEKYDKNGLDWETTIKNSYKCNIQSTFFPQLFLIQKYFMLSFPAILDSHFDKIDKIYFENRFIEIVNIQPVSSLELSGIKQEQLKNIKGFINKFKYIISDLFPSKQFMIRRYKIKNKNLFFLYYFKRWLSAFNRLFFAIFSRKKTGS